MSAAAITTRIGLPPTPRTAAGRGTEASTAASGADGPPAVGADSFAQRMAAATSATARSEAKLGKQPGSASAEQATPAPDPGLEVPGLPGTPSSATAASDALMYQPAPAQPGRGEPTDEDPRVNAAAAPPAAKSDAAVPGSNPPTAEPGRGEPTAEDPRVLALATAPATPPGELRAPATERKTAAAQGIKRPTPVGDGADPSADASTGALLMAVSSPGTGTPVAPAPSAGTGKTAATSAANATARATTVDDAVAQARAAAALAIATTMPTAPPQAGEGASATGAGQADAPSRSALGAFSAGPGAAPGAAPRELLAKEATANAAVDLHGASPAPPALPVSDPGTLAPASVAAPPSAPERIISVPLHSHHWPQAVAAEVRWLTTEKISSATLRLSPEHLGPVEVKISLRDGSVSVAFGAAQAETRSALERAIPQLHEMFASAGLTLGQATVQQQAQEHSAPAIPFEPTSAADRNEPAPVPLAVAANLGLLDRYA